MVLLVELSIVESGIDNESKGSWRKTGHVKDREGDKV
jgi:hypothetical protein